MTIPLLLLALVPFAEIRSDERPDSTLLAPPPRVEAAEAKPPIETGVLDLELQPERVQRADHASTSESARQSTRSFLYQVLLAAVTALVTALIWKAIM